MYGNFEATVSAQVVTADNSYELVFTLVLDCTSVSLPAIPAGLTTPGEPSEAPEFEFESVSINSDETPYNFGILPRDIFYAIVGPEIADELIADAIQQAIESGEF